MTILKKIQTYLNEDTNDCKNYNKSNSSCRSGCKVKDVIKGNICKFIDEQEECSCYK